MALLSLLFLLIVVATVIYHDTLFIPVFLGAFTLLKAIFKTLTPKLFLLVLKNSVVIKVRQLITRASTHLLVLSHRPVRLKIRGLKLKLSAYVVGLFQRYMASPLWLRTLIALSLLLLTASSSYVFIALLIIPQPLLNWVKKFFLSTLNKLGITQALNTIWRFVVPPKLKHRWDIYKKWTLGRKQIKTARQLHSKLADVPSRISMRSSPQSTHINDNVSDSKKSTDC